MAKRTFDLVLALLGSLILAPVFMAVAILIKITSTGPVYFKQVRVGRYGKEFKILKFRTMVVEAESMGKKITIGADSRITGIGKFLRKCKIDELPQLFNVILGEMSFVGPRPEVPEYVRHYTAQQRLVLHARPGITDYASIVFKSESEILASVENPESVYINQIMPYKISLNDKYLNNISLWHDLKIIFMTVLAVSGVDYSKRFDTGLNLHNVKKKVVKVS
jgi:lipopolysaccharide/colanic/teichoic acid biosynthesis glycosyltransferase